jgi:hypothetical protein
MYLMLLGGSVALWPTQNTTSHTSTCTIITGACNMPNPHDSVLVIVIYSTF